MIELYTSYCVECKKHTTQYASKINRARGIKLKCAECGKEKSRYEKLQNLTKLERQENEA